MSILGALVRGYLVQRLLHPRRPRGGYGHGPGYGSHGPGFEAYRYGGYGPTPYRPAGGRPSRHRAVGPWPAGRPARAPRRGRVGFAGPVPYYSRTTRRGARVSVGGCCLPIPLLVLASSVAAAAGAVRRHAGQRPG